MKRFSMLSQIRKILPASRNMMADFLSMSLSHYEKAEMNERSISTRAMILLSPLQVAFEKTMKEEGLPTGILNCRRLVLNNHKRHLLSKKTQIRRELNRMRLSFRFIKENWEFGSAQMNFMIKLKEQVPAHHAAYQLLQDGISRLTIALSPYSPVHQQLLQQYISSLEEQERCLSGMLNENS